MFKKIPFVLISFILLVAACNSNDDQPKSTRTPDKLSEIQARGTLIVASDPGYAPQSALIEGVARATDTKCGPNQATANQMEGFDVEVAKEVAERMGVEPCFVFPAWTLLTSGSWEDRWDISVGSMAITPERLELLYFAQPYYITPAAFFVHADNTTFEQPSDLSGHKIGVCAACTYEFYLTQTLVIPGQNIEFQVEDVEIQGYDVEESSFRALAEGDGTVLDAVLVALPTGLQGIANGHPLKQLGEPVFNEYLGIAIDRKHSKDPVSLYLKITEIIQAMHADGTLLALSQQFYGQDYTSAAAAFDLVALNQ